MFVDEECPAGTSSRHRYFVPTCGAGVCFEISDHSFHSVRLSRPDAATPFVMLFTRQDNDCIGEKGRALCDPRAPVEFLFVSTLRFSRD